MSLATDMDAQRAAGIPEAERCKCCDGTGNMLLSWYFKCLACSGDGHTRGTEAETEANAEFDRRFPPPASSAPASPDK